MMIDFLTTKYRPQIDEGWGALSIGNVKKAEEHFREVLANEHDQHVTVFDLVEAHNGMGAVSMAHRDYFEATRWYTESKYLLDQYYEGTWPERLSWHSYHDRGAMKMLIGLGHLAYERGDLTAAKKQYERLLEMNFSDELGVQKYLDGIQEGTPFLGL